MREGEPQFEELQPDLFNRAPLSIEEISKIRSDKHPLSGHHGTVQVRDYKLGDTEISVGNQRIDPADPEFKKNEKKVKDMVESKEQGEVYPCERVIVNALFEQANISKVFDLPAESMFRLDFVGGKTVMMASSGRINVLVLREQIKSLKKDGASDEQVITEISGHMLHETLHMCSDMESGFLQGRQSVGEFTSITGQLAYYLLKGYNGPSSYENKTIIDGNKQIDEGNDSVRDYDVATSVSSELLLEHLSAVFPEFAGDIEAETSLDACRAIIAKISPERRGDLVPCLKQAILESTDEERFKEILEKLKSKQSQQSISRINK